ncbi:MAG: hypothetical protein SGPRY_008076 [Prymnesium sp.]
MQGRTLAQPVDHPSPYTDEEFIEHGVGGEGWQAAPLFWLGEEATTWQHCEGANRAAAYSSAALFDLMEFDLFDIEFDREVLLKLGGLPFDLWELEQVDALTLGGTHSVEAEFEPLEARSVQAQQETAAFAAHVLSSTSEAPAAPSTPLDDQNDVTNENEEHFGFLEVMAAFHTLRCLPPLLSAPHHATVAALLTGREEYASHAAHTLACMGPQAVAEHFEKLATMGNPLLIGSVYRWDSAGILGSALLALSVLQPVHFQRLEARGAPSMLDVCDSICQSRTLQYHPCHYCEDVLDFILLGLMEASPGERHVGPIISEPESMLSSFPPVHAPQWSPATHASFPPLARARAFELLLCGYLIARSGLMGWGHVADIWVREIMPRVIDFRSIPGGSRLPCRPSAFSERMRSILADRSARREAEEEKRRMSQREEENKEWKRRREAERVEALTNPVACAFCTSGTMARTCPHACCGACCPGPCARHNK